MARPEPVIKLNLYRPLVLTLEEYDAAVRELEARLLVDEPTPLERIIAHALMDNRGRAEEVREMRSV